MTQVGQKKETSEAPSTSSLLLVTPAHRYHTRHAAGPVAKYSIMSLAVAGGFKYSLLANRMCSALSSPSRVSSNHRWLYYLKYKITVISVATNFSTSSRPMVNFMPVASYTFSVSIIISSRTNNHFTQMGAWLQLNVFCFS